MNLKAKIIAIILAILTAYAFGRYSAPTKEKIITKTVEVENKIDTTKIDAERNRRRETTTTKETHSDGSTTETTHTLDEAQSNTETRKSDSDLLSKSNTQEKEITRDSSKITISALAGLKLSTFSAPPIYGGQIYRPILGPIGVGIGAFDNGVFFFSVGLSF